MNRVAVIDLVQLKNYLIGMGAVILALSVFMTAMGGVVTGIAWMVAFLPCFCISYLLINNKGGVLWDQYRAALPFTRRQIIFGHYLCILICVVGTVLFTIALELIAFGVISLTNPIQAAITMENELGVGQTIGAFISSAIGMTITYSVVPMIGFTLVMPLTARFGGVKGFYMAIGIILALFLFLMLTPLGRMLTLHLMDFVFLGLFNPDSLMNNPLILGALVFGVCLVLFIASAPLAAWLYQRKDI